MPACISYYFALSLDGFIARPDGRVDWLDPWFHTMGTAYDFGPYLETVTAIVTGRKTFEDAQSLGPWEFGGRPTHVFTRDPSFRTDVENVRVETGALAPEVRSLKEKGEGRLWLIGGGLLARELLAERLVDELVLNVIPVTIGEGIPWLGHHDHDSGWALAESYIASNGIVQLIYRAAPLKHVPETTVERPAPRAPSGATYTTRMLDPDEIRTYVEHVRDADADSGTEGVRFHPYSKDTPFDVDGMVDRERGRWSTPVGEPDWGRGFGLFDADRLVGHLTLTGSPPGLRGPPGPHRDGPHPRPPGPGRRVLPPRRRDRMGPVRTRRSLARPRRVLQQRSSARALPPIRIPGDRSTPRPVPGRWRLDRRHLDDARRRDAGQRRQAPRRSRVLRRVGLSSRPGTCLRHCRERRGPGRVCHG